MVWPESLIVTAITWLALTVGYDRKTRAGKASSNATAYLNVLGCGLGLPDNYHQAESFNVDSDLDDVGRKTGL
jgi:hypothetical protein